MFGLGFDFRHLHHFKMSSIPSFIIYNFLVILIASITYFVMKEAVRVSGGKLSRLSFIASSLILGIELMSLMSLGGIFYQTKVIEENITLKV